MINKLLKNETLRSALVISVLTIINILIALFSKGNIPDSNNYIAWSSVLFYGVFLIAILFINYKTYVSVTLFGVYELLKIVILHNEISIEELSKCMLGLFGCICTYVIMLIYLNIQKIRHKENDKEYTINKLFSALRHTTTTTKLILSIIVLSVIMINTKYGLEFTNGELDAGLVVLMTLSYISSTFLILTTLIYSDYAEWMARFYGFITTFNLVIILGLNGMGLIHSIYLVSILYTLAKFNKQSKRLDRLKDNKDLIENKNLK